MRIAQTVTTKRQLLKTAPLLGSSVHVVVFSLVATARYKTLSRAEIRRCNELHTTTSIVEGGGENLSEACFLVPFLPLLLLRACENLLPEKNQKKNQVVHDKVVDTVMCVWFKAR